MDFDFDKPALKHQDLPRSPSVVFDIETGPAWSPGGSLDAAQEYCRPLGINFDPDAIGQYPGEFDPGSVRLGNMTDPAKIKAKVDAGREKHAAAIAKFESDLAAEEELFWCSIIDNAALSAVTGRVCAIGYLKEGKLVIDGDTSTPESELLDQFWSVFLEARSDGKVITGWNIHGFDVPFLLARSAKLGVSLPGGLFNRGKWLSETFVDCMQIWGQQHNPWKQKRSFASAKDVARFVGCNGRSNDEIEGKEFWRYWLGDPDQRKKAITYLTHDVEEEAVIARALGVI